MKPFQTGGFNLSVPKLSSPAPPPSPAWLGRSISTLKLRLLEHSAFVDQQRESDSYHKHLFVHIGGIYEYSDPTLEVCIVECRPHSVHRCFILSCFENVYHGAIFLFDFFFFMLYDALILMLILCVINY